MSGTSEARVPGDIATRFRSASIYSLATMAAGSILGLVNAILMARIFGATVLGQLAITIMLLQGFNLLSNAGEQAGLYFEIARRDRAAPGHRCHPLGNRTVLGGADACPEHSLHRHSPRCPHECVSPV